MTGFGEVDWARVFLPETSLVEIFVRGTVMYAGILLLLRFVGRRDAGGLALSDVLVVVLLSDAAQNGMAGEYRSIADGLFLVGVIIGWNNVIDRLAFHSSAVRRLVHPPPLALVREGRIIRANMRREYITEDELWSRLRAAGVSELAQVRSAQLEGTGEISVVRKEG